MRAILTALLLTIASQAGAECVNLCDRDCWKTATEADVQAGLNDGADLMARDENGNTPLHRAAEFGTPEVIQALLDVGADVMARDVFFGGTPLHFAARYGSPEVIQPLLGAGADAKAKDKQGKTAWNYAEDNKNLKGTKGYWALNDAQYN